MRSIGTGDEARRDQASRSTEAGRPGGDHGPGRASGDHRPGSGEAGRGRQSRPPPAATTAPAAAAKPAAKAEEPKIGKHLIGKLEGPEVLPDAKRPAKLAEAPMLAELVKAGKLPAVEQRIPLEPMIVKPLVEIGKYGGTWRRGSPARPTARTATGSSRPTKWSSGTTPGRNYGPPSPRAGR